MKKLLVGLFFLSGSFVLAESNHDLMELESVENTADTEKEELMELDEPYKYITGAYIGLSAGPTFVSHKIKAKNEKTKDYQNTSMSKTQWDIALLGGFGTSFYKDYYVGIELELMNRVGKGSHFKDNSDVFGFKFNPQFGINLNVRFGYLFPKQGNMIYAIAGFSRTLGKVVEKMPGGNENEKGFGSYYPVVGLGFEHKINYNWNARIDVKYSITTDQSQVKSHKNSEWTYNVKPRSIGVRFAITRNI